MGGYQEIRWERQSRSEHVLCWQELKSDENKSRLDQSSKDIPEYGQSFMMILMRASDISAVK